MIVIQIFMYNYYKQIPIELIYLDLYIHVQASLYSFLTPAW